MLSPPFEKVIAATAKKYRYGLFMTASLVGTAVVETLTTRCLKICTSLLMPMAIGTIPRNPSIYAGTSRGISEPRALIAISRPIPKYWPNTTWLTENVTEVEDVKRRISTKISSILVAANAVTPIATKPVISTANNNYCVLSCSLRVLMLASARTVEIALSVLKKD